MMAIAMELSCRRRFRRHVVEGRMAVCIEAVKRFVDVE